MFLGSALAVLVVLLVRNRYVFTARIYEDGDFALNSLLVQRAERLQLLVGNYSRAGFHHPGPGFLSVLAVGQLLFRDILHLVPTPYNGQVLGHLVFAALVTGWIVLIVHRVTGSRLAAGATLALALWFAGEHSLAGNLWFPYVYIGVFALMLVAAAAVAAGRTGDLPAFVLAAGLLVHGHVSFALFTLVTAVAVAAAWVARWRGGWREQVRTHRTAVRVSAGVLLLLVLPLVLQTAMHFPGPWPDYLRYATGPGAATHPLGAALRFLAWYWSNAQVPVALTAIAAAVGAALLATDRDVARRRYFTALYALLALQTVLFAAYLVRGVDALTPRNRYTGFFYLSVPLLLAVAAAAQLAARARRLGRAVPAAVAAAAVAVFAFGATRPNLTSGYRGSPSYRDAVTALAANPSRAGRTVVLRFAHDDWPLAAGLVLEGSRRGVPICVEDPGWTNLFTSRYVCQATASGWRVGVFRGGATTSGTTAVWAGPDLEVA